MKRWIAAAGLTVIAACDQSLPSPDLGDTLQYAVVEGPVKTIEDLNHVTSGIITADTTVVLVDASESHLRTWHATRGERTIGRRGPGPSEFQRPTTVAAVDGIAVFDWDGRRFTYYRPNFELIKTVAFSNYKLIGGFAGPFRDSSVVITIPEFDETMFVRLAGGKCLRTEHIDGALVRSYRQQMTLVTQDVHGWNADTIMVLAGPEYIRVDGSNRAYTGPVPFGRQTVWAASDSTIVVGTNDVYELEMISRTTKSQVGVIKRGSARRPLTRNAVKELAEERQRRSSALRNLHPNPAIAARRLRNIRTYTKAATDWAPDSMPYFQAVQFDSAGNVWVTRAAAPADQATVVDVFDRAGAFLGEVQVPGKAVVLSVARGFLLVVETDEWDEQRVRLYRLGYR